jgi:phage tail-like protein
MTQKFEFRLHITGPEEERDFVIPQGETLIGREPSVALPLVYPMVSRRHALLRCTEEECTITDLGSANGTLLNGGRINPNEPVPLADQMRITIGPFEITCVRMPLAAEEAAPAIESAPPPQEATPEPAVSAEAQPPGSSEAEKVKPEPAKPAGKAERPAKAKPAVQKPSEKPAGGAPSKEGPPGEPPAEGGFLPQVELPPWQKPIPGLSFESQRLINFLPGIYDTGFMRRFLGLFESILVPIEWNVDNFDLYLDAGTSPMAFLPWLSAWYEIVFDENWQESQRRTLLKEAHQIYARRGTRWALSRLIEIYTGSAPEIIEFADPKDPFTFMIKMPIRERDINRQLLELLIDSNKPAHTSYQLEFRN